MFSIASLGLVRNLIAGGSRLSRSAAAAASLLLLLTASATAREACQAPEGACAARAAVFAVSAFDPYGSAVRIGPELLVTNRHIVAGETHATVSLADGGSVEAEVVPTAFAGDLVLLRANLPPGPALAPGGTSDGALYTVGQDIGSKAVRVFPKGRLLFAPAPGKSQARLHHTAYSQPGTSGGALVDDKGALVGIVASGGEGRFEAIPAHRLAELKAESGPAYADRSREIGDAYRDCTEMLEQAGGGKLEDGAADKLALRCAASGNRQMFDMAAQTLGRARKMDKSVELFSAAVELDPNSINTRLGLVVTLVFARRHKEAVPHVRWLLEAAPEEPAVHQYAIQAGKLGGAPDLADQGLALIEKYNPAHLDAAKRFLAAPAPQPR